MAGYPLEEHFVTTADGYVVGTYRIPHGRDQQRLKEQQQRQQRQQQQQAQQQVGQRRSAMGKRGIGPASCTRPAVLLLHGLLDSSAAWVLNEPKQSLGFILADAGYDVWMGEWRKHPFPTAAVPVAVP